MYAGAAASDGSAAASGNGPGPPPGLGRSSRAIPIVAPGTQSPVPSAASPAGVTASLTSTTSHSTSSPRAQGPYSVASLRGDASTPASPLRRPANAQGSNNAGLSVRAATAAAFVPKSKPGTNLHGSSKSNASDVDSLTTSTSRVGVSPSSGSGSAAAARPFNPYAAAHVPAATESGRATPSSGQWETDGSNLSFDPTYMGPLPNAQSGGPPGLTPAHQQSGQDQQARAFNPYSHLDQYGQSTTGAASSFDRPRQPPALDHNLHTAPLPHVSNLHPHHLSSHAFFLSPSQREELARRNDAILTAPVPPEHGGPQLPEELHVYHSLVPLEAPGHGTALPATLVDPRVAPPTAPGASLHLSGMSGEPSRVFGYRTSSYKALCTLDGKAYVLRRIEGFRLLHDNAITVVERWRRIRHPSIVSVREAFTTRAFGDSSIVFVYDYHPLATTLYGEHMVPKPPQVDRRTGRLQTVSMQIQERTLWSYAVQLTNVLRNIHSHGLAARCIEPSKVLRTSKNRVRLNCCSIFDVVAFDPRANTAAVQSHQADDLLNLGKLLVSLACNSMGAVQNLPKSLESISRLYSADFKNVVLWLVGKPSPGKTADELGRMLGSHIADEVDSALNYADLLESGLSKELENARLVRLLCKFGFINERPEFDHDPRWSETGDRYVIKLFRDHVFHAVDDTGRPLVDLSHILSNLNKLDAGSEERVMLTSRDAQSCLVVSYREIKNCVEAAFQDLSRAR